MSKAFSRKSFKIGILMLLLLLTWGALLVQADTDNWTDHADTAWYDNYSNYTTFTIDSPAKLAGAAKLVNNGTTDFRGKILAVDRNLSLSAYTWVPIGTQNRPFRGNLIANGGGPFTISNIAVNGNYSYAGFIGNMENATVGGFVLSGSITVNTTDEAYVGGLAGRVKSSGGSSSYIYDVSTNVSLNLTVTGNTYAGYAGGVAGSASGTINNVANSAPVTVTGVTYQAGAGGIAGSTEGPLTLKTANNTAAVYVKNSGAAAAGGIIGQVNAGLLMAEGNTVIKNSGGVKADGTAAYSGGIIGRLAAAADSVGFSDQTANSGSVQVNAANSTEAYAGSLAGLFEKDLTLGFNYVNSGSVTNQAKDRVYTGGLAGRIKGNLTVSRSFTNTVDIQAAASGTNFVYTGSVAGYVDGNITGTTGFQIKNQGKLTVTGSASKVYTGGLFGAAGGQVAFGSTQQGAYVNSGDITVTGKLDIYTGGIISSQAYTQAANNVSNTGNITVTGDKALYTGGYIGKIAAAGANLSGEQYAKTIRVNGNAAQNTDLAAGIFTGGIVGLVEQAGTIDGASFTGTLAVAGGEYTYTGGIVGYLGAGTISGANAGNTAASQATVDSDGDAGGIAGYAAGSIQSSAPEYITIRAQGQNGLAGRVGAIAGETAPTAVIGSGASPVIVKNVNVTSTADKTVIGGAVGENRSGNVYISMPLTEASELTLQSSGADSIIGGVFGKNSASLAAANLPNIRNIKLASSGVHAQAGGIIGQNAGTLNGVSILNPDISAEGQSSIAGLLAGRSSGGIVQPKVFSEDDLSPKLTVNGPQSVAGGIAGILENAAITGNGVDAAVANALINATGDGSIAGGIAGQSILSNLDSVVSDSPVITISGAGSTAGGIAGESKGAGNHIQSSIVQKPLITATGANSKVGGIAGHAENEIINSSISAEEGEYAILKVGGANSLVGGITGKAAAASISGNAQGRNAENVLIHLLEAADGTTAGGAVGWNEATPIRSLYAVNVKITDNAPHSTVGGLVGYHKGSSSALIADNYMSAINITANASSGNSVLGGLVGLNDTRAGGMDDGDPRARASSIQNNRSLGSLTVNSSDSKVGGLVGENHSVIANTSISDGFRVVSQGSQNTVGGLVGLNAKTVYYSFSSAVLTLGGSRTTAGGLVGENTGLVASSYINNDISADISGTGAGYGYLGGLIGKNSGTVDRSYTSSVVSSNGAYANVGGLVGWQDSGSVDSSYTAKNVLAQGGNSFAGGFFGRITGGTAKDSYSAGQISGENGAYAGAFAGRYDTANKELLENNYYVKDETLGINSGLLDFAAGNYYELKLYRRLSPILSSSLADREAFKVLSGWDFSSQNKLWTYGTTHAAYIYPELVLEAGSGGGPTQPEINVNISWYTQHKEDLRFSIGTEAELAGLAAIVNGSVTGLPRFDFAGRVVELTAPIRIQSAQWIPIGNSEQHAFEGSFNGKNYLISGLRVDKPDFSGLFGVAGSSAVISQVKLEPAAVTGASRVGALVAWNKGQISNVNINVPAGGYLTGGMYTGGVAGESQGTIRQAAVAVDATGEIRSFTSGAAVGGVIGYGSAGSLADTTITMNGGIIKGSGSDSSTGGAAGISSRDHTVSGIRLLAHNEGIANPVNITGSGNVGGIIGTKTGKESAVWDVSDVTIEQAVISAGTGGNAGGVAGSLEKSALLNGVSKGIIKLNADGANVGGIAGRSLDSIIYKATAAPDITLSTSLGASNVGGIAGIVETTVDTAFDFGKILPLYRGITLSKAEGGTVRIVGTGNQADVSVGGVVGLNKSSSLYYANAASGIEASGVKTASIGGIAGRNQGDIVNGVSTSVITASNSSIYNAGGIAGLSTGGRIFYSQANAGSTVNINGTVGNSGVTTAAHTGGFVGRLADTIIRNSVSDSIVRVASDNPYTTLYTGSFAGLLESGGIGNGSIERSFAKGSVTVSGKAGSYAGGFAGDIDQYTIQEAYASGTVSNTAFDARSGGFAGMIDQGAVIAKAYAAQSSVEAIGAHGATRAYAGGFAGYNNGTLTETYAAVGHMASLANGSNSYVGSFIGYNFRDGQVNNSYYEGDTGIGHGTAVQGLTRADLSVQESLAGWDSATDHAFWAYLDGSNGGKPVLRNVSSWTFAPDMSFMMEASSAGSLVITSEQQLGAVVALLNDSDLSFYRLYHKNAALKPTLSKVTLGRDVNLSGALWIPFEEFTGEWDGGGKKIAGISSGGKGIENFGFVRINKGTIRNTVFADAHIAAGSNVGIVAGTNAENGVISSITVSGKVSGSGDYVGGAVGKSIGVLSGVAAGNLEISGRDYVAGIAGSAKQLSNIQTGDITVTAAHHAGGIAGEAAGISNVAAGNVTVKGEGMIGGVAGAVTGPVSGIRVTSVTVEAASGTAAGVVSETDNEIKDVELSGVNVKGSGYIGGIAGKTTAAISGITVTGKTQIVAIGSFAGAIAGSAKQVANIRTGDISVTAAHNAGGTAGEAAGISNVAAGNVTVKGEGTLGGMAGAVTGPISGIRATSVTVEASNGTAAGVVSETDNEIKDVELSGVNVKGSDYIGGIASKTTAAISGITVTGKTQIVATGNFAGALAGSAKQVANIRTGDISVTAVHHAGGIAGEAAGISNVAAGNVTVKGEGALGGMAGAVTGPISGIRATSVTVEAASGTAAGVVSETDNEIKDVEISGVNIKGSGYIGGIAGKTTAAIIQASIQGELSIKDGVAGGIVGRNEGSIDRSHFKGAISGKGHIAGGLAGENMARIEASYAVGSIDIKKDAAQVKIGGLAGTSVPAAVIEKSFSAAELHAEADVVSAGGIVGENEGSLNGVLNAGNIHVSGQSITRIGGITGYALAGSINNVLSYGQVEGAINGLMIYKKTFYGGIAGQVADQVSIANAFGDRQMLKEDIVYSDSSGQIVRSVPGKAENLKTGALVKGTLYTGLDATIWKASAGLYPRLAQFDGVDTAKLAAAAVVLNEYDTAYHVKSSYTLTNDPSIVWKTVNKEAEVQLVASLQQESKTITVNKQALMYADTALKPTGLSNTTFDGTVNITLSADEPKGIIYYTLDGSRPTEESLRYNGPFALTQTTTVKAIVVAGGKNDSEAVQALYTKRENVSGGGSGGGGGGGFMPTTGSNVDVLVNGKPETAGSETTLVNGSTVTTTIAVNEPVMGKILEQQGDKAEITIMFNKSSDISIGEMSAEFVKSMENKNAVLKVNTGTATYTIPAQQLHVNAISEKLGKQAALKDIKIRIEIRTSGQEQVKQLATAAANGDFTVLMPPISFKASYMYGDITGELDKFSTYVERMLAIKDEATANKVTTGVVVEANGAVSHVPTKIRFVDGKAYAAINSLTNGITYSLIAHPMEFKDAENHWAKEAINDMGSRMVVGGVGEGLYEPNRDITRGEFAAIVVKALGLKAEVAGNHQFGDIKASDWYAPYIQAAHEYGIISGYDNGSFGAMDKITREQSMTIIARAMKITGMDAALATGEQDQLLAGFKDSGLVADYAKSGIAASLKAGLVSGRSSSLMAPADNMTRAEVASIIQKLLQKSGLI
ncbi:MULTISPECIES: S-layer homology domain-containing protein [unclassified Paenibacillus]|uniref:S-layer homology domain-containing protein n=1 Tax=unclassified Paenibacillus TaxID=185978 RepID=UPI00362631CA